LTLDLTPLLEDYIRAQPNRALGGVRALSGFEYQVRAYLADFARALVDGTSLADEGEGFANAMEALSDHTRQDGAATVCVQVKRTLTRQTLADAAGEFVLVDEFLEQRGTPAERAQIRYECVARSGDPALNWDQVQLPAKLTSARPELKARLQRLREGDHLLAPRIEPDPWWRLITTVYKHVADPFAFAREALDLSLGRGLDADGARRVRNDITDCFARHRARAAPAFEYLVAEDFEPLQNPSADVVVGTPPTLHALRDAQFMQRPQALQAVRKALDAVVAERDRPAYRLLDIFWIDGRSGSGKSVLLLQLIESLAREGARVLWLRNRPSGLLEILRSIETHAPTRGPEYIFVDDLYDPQGRTRLDLDEVVSLVTYRGDVNWPLLVTCGPPEFHADLHRDAAGQARLHTWRIPAVDQAESNTLRGWFSKRAGKTACTGPAFEQDEGLMVSMMFELRHGNLEQLAHRFRKRLEHAGLAETLYQPLALNRLYVLSPGDWLGERERIQLEAINQDRDFSFLSIGDGAGYLKLTHPHLSDAIYRAVRQPGIAMAYTQDLVGVFAHALRTDPPTALRLMRVLASGHERLEILDQPALAKRCAESWRAADAASDQLPEAMRTELRVQWAVWATTQPVVAQALQVDPLADACAALTQGHTQWVRLWHLLSAAYPNQPQVLELGATWATDPTHFDARYWSILWESLLDADWSDASDSESRLDGLIALGRRWLEGHEHLPDWNYVWQRLVKAPDLLPDGALDALLLQGWRWGERRHDLPGWAHVWEQLMEHKAELRHEVPTKELMRRGHSWLEGREDAPEWSYVWKFLLNHAERLPRDINRTELFQRGVEWLDGRDEVPAWGHVWRFLFERCVETPERNYTTRLYHRGLSWLPKREANPAWRDVCNTLLAYDGTTTEELSASGALRTGEEWLVAKPDNPAWPWICDCLIRYSLVARDVDFGKRFALHALDWVAEHEKAPAWFEIFNRLVIERELLEEPSQQKLLDHGATWAAKQADGSVLANFWKTVSRCGNDVLPSQAITEARSHTISWLKQNFTNSESPDIFVKLCTLQHFHLRDMDLLAEKFADWLESDKPNAIRPFVIQALTGRASWWNGISLNESMGSGWKRLTDTLRHVSTATTTLILGLDVGDLVLARIVAKSKRGYHVTINQSGDLTAFLPRKETLRPFNHIGSSAFVVITHLDKDSLSIKVSRRATINTETDKSQQIIKMQLERSKITNGVVANITEQALFIDVGGINGMLHVSNLIDPSDGKLDDRYAVGDEIRVRILKVDRSRGRITLEEYRDSSLEGARERATTALLDSLALGQVCEGTVTNVVDYGLFVDIGGINGLLHYSKLADARRRGLKDRYNIGKGLCVRIIDLDKDLCRISLEEQLDPAVSQARDAERRRLLQSLTVDQVCDGIITNIVEYGLFVELGGIHGLLHHTKLNHPERIGLKDRYTKGKAIRVQIIDIDSQRGRIGLAECPPDRDDRDASEHDSNNAPD
jgi:predicted RNA-binding protein with RPS1 domain